MAKVLIIDDSPTEVVKIRQLLERNGHDVLEASDGADGVAVARSEQPDLVLMDVVMPALNGFQATRQLTKNEQTAHIPVVIVTSKDQETDRVWGVRQGAKDYLVKPIDKNALLDTVNRVLAAN